MSSPAKDLPKVHRLTIHDYRRMGETGILHEDSRVELIEGEIIDMTPIGSRHAGTVRYLSDSLAQAFRGIAVVSTQNPVILGDHSEPQPDLALLRPRRDFYRLAHPKTEDVLLIIEVADSSIRYDREIKLPLYARHGIPEVWLIDIETRRLETFRQPAEQGYRETAAAADLSRMTVLELPDAALDLSDLFLD